MIDREKLFRPDGTVKGVRYARAHTTRAQILSLSLERKGQKPLVNSFSLGNRDFTDVYTKVINLIVAYYQLTEDNPLVQELHDSRDQFLIANNLTTRRICYDQVTPLEENP